MKADQHPQQPFLSVLYTHKERIKFREQKKGFTTLSWLQRQPYYIRVVIKSIANLRPIFPLKRCTSLSPHACLELINALITI
jgi:hypothetical protein